MSECVCVERYVRDGGRGGVGEVKDRDRGAWLLSLHMQHANIAPNNALGRAVLLRSFRAITLKDTCG
jgi:hypothetical protein